MEPNTYTLETVLQDLADQLTLPQGFLRGLLDEDDWSFVIKAHSFVEAALTHLLVTHFGNPALEPIFAQLQTSNPRTGKLAFIEACDLLDKPARRFVHSLSELRNHLVHDVSNVSFAFPTYVASMSDRQRREFLKAFDYVYVALIDAGQIPEKYTGRSSIDRIVLAKPKTAMAGGLVLLAAEVYFLNRVEEHPDVLRHLSKMLLESYRVEREWRGDDVSRWRSGDVTGE
ncbi:MAG: hypothetical protein U0822_03610 [Anaerolineae bacterium]